MSRLTRDGTAETVSRDQIPSMNADREIFMFPVQLTTGWQPYPFDPYSCYMCDHTYYTYIHISRIENKAKNYLKIAI